jgi:DNA-binding response OmpR family regulator
MNILVVDDDPGIRTQLEAFLKSAGFSPVMADDGSKAWTLLEKEPEKYSTVLLDRMMPNMDGMEVLRRIKTHEKLRNIPVIMQTAKIAKKEILEGLEAGAHYYLTKPFDKDTVLAIVRTATNDSNKYNSIRNELKQTVGTLSLMSFGHFSFRTNDEATSLATLLAHATPNPEDVVHGLKELLLNAIEHGNLGITYEEKSELIENGKLDAEINFRLTLPEHKGKTATLEFSKTDSEIRFFIKDKGDGFDWEQYMTIKPERAFDNHGRGIAMANQVSFSRIEYKGKGNEVVAVVHTD